MLVLTKVIKAVELGIAVLTLWTLVILRSHFVDVMIKLEIIALTLLSLINKCTVLLIAQLRCILTEL